MPDAQLPTSDPRRGLDRGELQERAIRGALWTLVHTVTGVGLGFLVNILLARRLGVVDFGRLAYLTTVMGIFNVIVSLGVDTGVIQFGAKAHARGEPAAVRDLMSKAQGFRLLVFAPLMTVGVIAIVRVDWVMLVLAIIFGVWVPAALGGALDALVIENKTAREAQNAMLINLLTQAGVVAAALWIGTADSVWAVRTVVAAVSVASAIPFISRVYRGAVFRPRLPRHLPPGFWRFALPAGAAEVIGSLVQDRTQVVILTWMHQASAAGIFALAFGLSIHLFSPAQALVGPLTPAVSGLREVDESAVGRALGRTVRASATAVGLLLGAAMPAFALLVPLIYGADYVTAQPILLALGISGGLTVLTAPVLAFVKARLQGQRLLWVNVVAVVVSVGLAVVLIPILGIWGAVAGNIGGVVIGLVLLLGGELRTLSYPASQALRDIVPLLIGGLVSWTAWVPVGLLGVDLMSPYAVVAAVVAGAIGLFLVLGLMWVTRTGMTRADGEAISRALPTRLASGVGPLFRLVCRRIEA